MVCSSLVCLEAFDLLDGLLTWGVGEQVRKDIRAYL
jgi:hypothetical protein